MKKKYTTTIYFALALFSAGFLFLGEYFFEKKPIIPTILAVVVLMFGVYRMISLQKSNIHTEYKDQEYFNGEKYWKDEEE
ncbi:hypothetical protein [Kordia zhangzhouensis]|uniref:hypothetical protein n=1 Tax=Kordia zhangzhouensis TaxID=1620405 RepID=UPI0006298AE6|nr:hypothetical protein [Kordia zhangzhouensis]